MSIPGFFAEPSVDGRAGRYAGEGRSADTGSNIQPQLRILYETCRRVSAHYCACGAEDPETGTSRWAIVRC